MKEFEICDDSNEDMAYTCISLGMITDVIDGKIDEQNVLKDDLAKQIEGIDNGITSIEESDTIKKISVLTDEGKALVTQRKEKEEKRDRDLKDWKKILKESEGSLINFKRLVSEDTKSIETNEKRVEAENLLIGAFDEADYKEKLEKCEKADQLTEKYEGVLKNINEKRDNTIQKIADFGAAITHRYMIKKDLVDQSSKAVEGKFICGECQSTVTKEHIDQKIAESDALIKKNAEGKSKVEEVLVKIEEAKVSTEERLKRINEYKLLHQQLVEQKNKFDKAKVDIVTYTEWLDNAKTTLKSYKDNIVTLTSKVDEYTKKCDNIDKEYHASVIEINIEIEKKREEIKSLNEDANKLKEELKAFRLLKEKKANSIQEINKTCGSLTEKKAGVIELDLQIVEHEEVIVLVRKELQRYAILESSFGLGGVQTRVVARYLPLLNDYVKKYLNILSDGKLSVKVFVNSKTKVDMEIIGGTADTYVMLSGGEKMIVRLAVDIGLSLLSFYRTQKVPDMICLDEIFGPLDKNRTKSVFLMLEELKTRFNRVFLISHKSEIQSLVEDNIIVDKNAGNLGLSKIVEINEITV
jgi:DNA repair exonuclease SbcCD ATPase subunit